MTKEAMIVVTTGADSELCIPSGSKVSRRYEYKLFYGLGGIYKEQGTKWSKFEPSWSDPIPVSCGGHALFYSDPASWLECRSMPNKSAKLVHDRSVNEYRLGGGCTLVEIKEGQNVRLTLKAHRIDNVATLLRQNAKWIRTS
jgi:hypothetical protein